MEDQWPQAGKRPIDAAFARGRCEVAMLELSGEIGYRAVTVEQVLSHSGVSLEQFEAEFGDLDRCFLAAYEAEADVLCEAMLDAAARAGDWRAGIRAALETLLRFVAERPAVGRALIRDVHVVGGSALAKHEEVLERLTSAIATCPTSSWCGHRTSSSARSRAWSRQGWHEGRRRTCSVFCRN